MKNFGSIKTHRKTENKEVKVKSHTDRILIINKTQNTLLYIAYISAKDNFIMIAPVCKLKIERLDSHQPSVCKLQYQQKKKKAAV